MAVRRLSQVQQHTPNPQPPSLRGKGAISPPLLGERSICTGVVSAHYKPCLTQLRHELILQQRFTRQ
ncbi:hypothetical protein SAMD00079811_41160 [Scytonema sp. HK-05]|nr:hypothetical protein SAMD00079811_41160 [Scytonema sp. HK-05]